MRLVTNIPFEDLREQLVDNLSPLHKRELIGSLIASMAPNRQLTRDMAQLGYVPAINLEDAAKRLGFAANWIENSYGGPDQNVELVRSYARAARAVIAGEKTSVELANESDTGS